MDCQQDITPEDLVHGILITDGDEEEGEEIHAPLARLQVRHLSPLDLYSDLLFSLRMSLYGKSSH